MVTELEVLRVDWGKGEGKLVTRRGNVQLQIIVPHHSIPGIFSGGDKLHGFQPFFTAGIVFVVAY